MDIQHLEKTISKKQKESFLSDSKTKIDGVGISKGRKDSGTRANTSRHHEYKRDDIKFENEFKKKRDKIFERQEMEWESMEEDREEDVVDQKGYWENEAGMDEFHHLNRNGVAHINEKTEFSDGSRFDGSYRDEYMDEPTVEELNKIKAEEASEAKQIQKQKNFERNKTYRNRLGSQDARRMM